MKRKMRYVGVILILVILVTACLPVTALAADDTIDVSTASKGYFTVSYTGSAAAKVAVTFGGKTVYSDFAAGKDNVYAFDKGNGSYKIELYRNISGNSYSLVSSRSVSVKLDNDNSRYLVSTTEIAFAADDAVSAKAAELCEGLTTDSEKVVAIFKFISANYKYDRALAKQITSGEISTYVPDTAKTLAGSTGICYDLSALFAAMCRSQNIQCAITKGYVGSVYHAWNKVMVDGSWYAIDMTYSLGRNLRNVNEAVNCASRITSYSNQSDDIVVTSPYKAA